MIAGGVLSASNVSILARPEGRALPYSWDNQFISGLFQSSPVPKDGRYDAPGAAVFNLYRFNPRPSRRTGATPNRSPIAGTSSCFNPRPSRRTGATRDRRAGSEQTRSFNPRPSRRTGATDIDIGEGKIGQEFQSSPVPKDGRYHCSVRHDRASGEVSILARPEGRALRPLALRRSRGQRVSILARPEGRALHMVFRAYVAVNEFQSSPVPKDGRYQDQSEFSRFSHSFNPRPSRRTGATSPGCFLNGLLICFNPRPSRRTGATSHDATSCRDW